MLNSLIMTLFLIVNTTFANNEINSCDLYQELASDEFVSLEKHINKELNLLANIKSFSIIADMAYAKTDENKITKSIQKWAVEIGTTFRKEKNIIKEWRYHFLRGLTLPSFNTMKSFQQELVREAFKNIDANSFTEKRKKVISARFDEAKVLSLKVINAGKFKKKTKTHLISIINKLELKWLQNLSSSHLKRDPNQYLNSIATYVHGEQKIYVGHKVLRYFHDADTITSYFAQEIAKAFDPCKWSAYGEKNKFNHPFQKVLTCLRSKESIEARKRDDKLLTTKLTPKDFSPNEYAVLRYLNSCNSAKYPRGKDQAEQINTAFADWFSAEAMSKKKTLSKHMREDLCVINQLPKYSAFPQGMHRLDKIYLANPKVSKMMKVSSRKKFKYCGL